MSIRGRSFFNGRVAFTLRARGIRTASVEHILATAPPSKVRAALSKNVGQSFLLRENRNLVEHLFSSSGVERGTGMKILEHIRLWNAVARPVENLPNAEEALKELFPMDPAHTGRKTFLHCDAELLKEARDAPNQMIELEEPHVRHLKARRAKAGDGLVLFCGSGAFVSATLHDQRRGVALVDSVGSCPPSPIKLRVCSAIPKGDRDDQMISCLSELGVEEFVALSLKRQGPVMLTESRVARYHRLAVAAAEQSRNIRVMRSLPHDMSIAEVVANGFVGYFGDPSGEALSGDLNGKIVEESFQGRTYKRKEITLVIGAEGGFSDDELHCMKKGSFVPVRLSDTVLRVETAAIALASAVSSRL